MDLAVQSELSETSHKVIYAKFTGKRHVDL